MFKKFLLAVLLVALVAPIFGYEDLPTRMVDVELRKNTFDHLERSNVFTLASDSVVTPNDVVSTYSNSIAYQGSVEPPFLLRVQNLGTTGIINFREYVTTTAGVDITVATDSYLPSAHGNYLTTATSGQLAPGEVWEKVCYQDPNLSFGGTCTFSVQIWTRPTQ